MPVGRSRLGTNQEGALSPQVSAWGAALNGARSLMVDQPRPIGTKKDINFFGGTIGATSTNSANVGVYPYDKGYFGDMPQTQQDKVAAPPPWERV